MLAFDNRPKTKEERQQKVDEVKQKAFITLEGAENHRFLYRDAIEIINQNMSDLKKKQVREMLIYKTNQCLKPPRPPAPR